MFAADLSWTDHGVEKVGERRERKARERVNHPPSSAGRGSQSSKSSNRSSILSDDRETWWPVNLKKARAVKPAKRGKLDADQKVVYPRKASSAGSRPAELEASLKDPTLQPEWTYSTSLRPTLPSGAPLDPPDYEPPELDGDVLARRRANSKTSTARSSHERQADWKSFSKVKVIDEVHEVQQLSPKSYIARTTRRSSETIEPEIPRGPKSDPPHTLQSSYSVEITGCGDEDSYSLDYGSEDASTAPSEDVIAPTTNATPFVAWRPPSNWDILPSESVDEKELPPLPNSVSLDHGEDVQFTRFSFFIRRMESAGPKMIIERLKKERQGHVNEEADEGWRLEKQLWLLTAFQLQSLSKSVTPHPVPALSSLTSKGKFLELYGDLAEVYQLAAMRPKQKIHYLSADHQRAMPLPANVTYLSVPQAGIIPFPYPAASFSHIRASTLPSLVPSSRLPQIFKECRRLLVPGGVLEIRIMDASPVRRTAGPQMRTWIEDRVSLNLERLFRCSKPCLLVPNWIADAGFELLGGSGIGQMMRMPCAHSNNGSVDEELSALVGRALWKDIWGSFVSDEPGQARWWWEDEGIIEECLDRKTVFECGVLFAIRR